MVQLTPSGRSARTPRRALGAALALALAAGACLGLAAQPSVAQVTSERVATSAPFRVATFNILGANHTRNSSRFDTYEPRMRRTVRLIGRQGFDIVGLQEYQPEQHELFVRLAGDRWGVYPGLEEGRRPVANSIIWRKADWRIVEKRLYAIPYFRGTMVQQPYVKLRNSAGVSVWVINTHNPADSKGPAQRYRDQAMAIQVDLANELRRTGLPVVLLGDFNERDEAFCTITGGTELKAVNGGGWPGGRCDPPSWMRIDWIFVSKYAGVSNYTDLYDTTTQYITDHHVISADLTVPLP